MHTSTAKSSPMSIAGSTIASSHPWLMLIFLTLILDGRFILWRLGMYLPFALFAGLMIKLRPTLAALKRSGADTEPAPF